MDCKEKMAKATTIKETTINQLDLVFSQKKKYYRNIDFPFPISKNGYSTHQGAVMRQYLRQKGYMSVRVSEITSDFFKDNVLYVRKLNDYNKDAYLKCSNTIIILKTDFEKYKKKKPEVKPVLIGMGKVTTKANLIDKYTERLNEYTQFLKEHGDTISVEQRFDCREKMNYLKEFIFDLKTL